MHRSRPATDSLSPLAGEMATPDFAPAKSLAKPEGGTGTAAADTPLPAFLGSHPLAKKSSPPPQGWRGRWWHRLFQLKRPLTLSLSPKGGRGDASGTSGDLPAGAASGDRLDVVGAIASTSPLPSGERDRVRGSWRRFALVAGVVAIGAAIAAGIGGALVWRSIETSLPPLPDPKTIAVSSVVVDRDGKLLRPFTTADGRWRLPVTVDEVDPQFLKMLIGYEDQHFYTHHGVDPLAVLRAAGQFVLAGGHIVSGGSTLTMQVARLIDGDGTRSVMGKLRQMALAETLEARFSKGEILHLYLLLAPYGGNIEGIRAASLAYFGKEPKRLTTAEAALLVALPQSPEARRPDRDATAARVARDRVLDRLVAEGVVDKQSAEAARFERMPVARQAFPLLAPHLAVQAVQAAPDEPMHRLTVARDLQASLERLAADRVGALGPKLSVAMVVADEETGDILASVGSAGLFEDQRDGHVDMTRAIRSPGSTLKPLIYGLAFEQGLAVPETLIEDRPTGFHGYAPSNFDGFNRGTVTVREALQESLNVPAIVALNAVGPAKLVARLKRAAVSAQLPDDNAPGLAIGLGGVGVTLRDLVSLYAAIARGGTAVALNDGVAAVTKSLSGAPVLSPAAAWYVSDVLLGVPPPLNGIPGRIAYKTGTSYGYRDAWAIGFDGADVIGVWVGRPDGTPVPGLSGYVSAAPLLFEAFDRIGARRVALRRPPPGVLRVSSTAALPAPLRRFRDPGQATFEQGQNDPEIAYPLDGVSVDLGIAAGDPSPLVIKVRNGAPPFTWFVNGAPFARTPFARSETWKPDGPGFVTLSVVDRDGRSDRVTVRVE
jgi:penicillin-binding protein 1C